MPRYIIEIPIKGFEVYVVDADTEDKALELIKGGDVGYAEQRIEDTYYENADIQIEE